jgi:hypothetical protein
MRWPRGLRLSLAAAEKRSAFGGRHCSLSSSPRNDVRKKGTRDRSALRSVISLLPAFSPACTKRSSNSCRNSMPPPPHIRSTCTRPCGLLPPPDATEGAPRHALEPLLCAGRAREYGISGTCRDARWRPRSRAATGRAVELLVLHGHPFPCDTSWPPAPRRL